MPRYFFHLRNAGKSLQDCQGLMFRGQEAACQEARQSVQDFFQPSTGRVAPEWAGWSVEVCDERGRCFLFMPFADAPKLREIASEPTEAHASSHVVQLDVARAKRELVAMETQTRELVRRTAMLVDRNRYEAKRLYHLMQAAGEARVRAQQLVARSRQQTASAEWSSPAGGTPSMPTAQFEQYAL
jgi:uncharacterized protein DUF6894